MHGPVAQVCWSCVSGLEVVLISSGVDVLLGAEKLNSSSEEFKQETDNNQSSDYILHELLPVHPLLVHLQHHMN